MGGDRVSTIWDKPIETRKAEEIGLIEISYGLKGMHIRSKVKLHPCDPCTIMRNFDPENCDGCSKEMELMTYVPPNLRRRL